MPRLQNITGIEKVERAFRNLPRSSTAKIADALNRGAEEVAKRAEQIAPEDEGDLKDTIKPRSSGIRQNQRGNPVVYVVAGTSADTANAAFRQEFGRASGPGDHRGHPAQPFLFPAYWSLRKRIRGRIARAIKAATKEAARGR